MPRKLLSPAELAKLILLVTLPLAAVSAARADNFVFETASARLTLRSDGIAVSLVEKQNGQERLRPEGRPFAAVRKAGKVFPVSKIDRQGGLFHVTFGESGISADYRITASADSIVLELMKVQGDGIQELRLMQLSTPLSTQGELFGVQWDKEFAVCLMGLSERVNVEVRSGAILASVYPEFGMQGERVALIAVPTPEFLYAVQKAEREFQLPSPTIGGKWAKLSPDVCASYLFTDLTEANADETIRYAKMAGFRYILIYSSTWSSSLGSYPINLKSFPHGEAGLKSVIDKCHASGLKVGMHMLTSVVGKNDPLAGPKPDAGLLKTGGATAQHLVELDGSFLADLKSPLANTISDRIAGLIDRAGFDMIYFDGGELNSADGPPWYWTGVQQQQIWERSKRDLLVQGSGTTPWTWHIFSRGTSDDYAAVAVKQYLDNHKIADSWRLYHNSFLPAELGWVGLLEDTPDHPATTPDEIEYYAVRALALDSPLSIETSMNALKTNGRSGEMLKLLGEYEQLRLSGAVPKTMREQLAHGEWHMTGRGEYHPIRYDAQRTAIPGEITVTNGFAEQPLKFRLQVEPELAPPGDPVNILLLKSEQPIQIQGPAAKAAMPDALIESIRLGNAAQNQGNAFMVGPDDRGSGKALDLTTHRSLAVQLVVEGPAVASGQYPVLNLQLEAGEGTYRNYYIDLNFRGTKTVILPEPGTSRTLVEFRPAAANYSFKAAMYSFNYANVTALNLRWSRYPASSGVRCQVGLVEALTEKNTVLQNIRISTKRAEIEIPGQMLTGEYAEYWGQSPIRIFDHNGVLERTVPGTHAPELRAGENKLMLNATGPGSAKLTAITLGK